jgi:hypothetical protein
VRDLGGLLSSTLHASHWPSGSWCRCLQVYAFQLLLMRIDGSALSNNTASVSGGCIWAGGTGCMFMQGSRVENCTAGTAGGGLWLDTGGTDTAYSGCSPLVTEAMLPGLSLAAQKDIAGSAPLVGRRLSQAAPNSSGYSLVISGSSSLTGNSAGMGGGALIQISGGSAVLVDSLAASSNSASGSGGAMAVLSAG